MEGGAWGISIASGLDSVFSSLEKLRSRVLPLSVRKYNIPQQLESW